MPRLNAKPDEHEREFQVNIVVSETGACWVKVMERGESQSGASATTPLSGILGLRECLRLGRLMVTQFYATKQRALDLTAAAVELKERERERRQRPPRPQKPVILLKEISGPLVDAAVLEAPPEPLEGGAPFEILEPVPVPWIDNARAYVNDDFLDIDQVSLERPGEMEEGFQTHSVETSRGTVSQVDRRPEWWEHRHGSNEPESAGEPPPKEDEEAKRKRLLTELIELTAENNRLRRERHVHVHEIVRGAMVEEAQAAAARAIDDRWTADLIAGAEEYTGPLTDEQKEIAREVVHDYREAVIVEDLNGEAEPPLSETLPLSMADLPAAAKVPGIDTCLECEKDLAVTASNQAVCRNPACSYYEPPPVKRSHHKKKA